MSNNDKYLKNITITGRIPNKNEDTFSARCMNSLCKSKSKNKSQFGLIGIDIDGVITVIKTK